MQFNEFFLKYFKHLKALVSALFWLLLIFAFSSPAEGIMTVLSAAVHEMGHYSYSLFFLKSPSAPYGVWSGLRMKKSGLLSYSEEIMLYLCGPLANLLFSILILPCFALSFEFARDLSVINIFTMLANLLPIEGYDGYGAILAIAGKLGMEWRTREVLRHISFFLTVVMLFISLYLMYYLNGGYWIFAVFSVSALSFIKKAMKSQKQRFQEI